MFVVERRQEIGEDGFKKLVRWERLLSLSSHGPRAPASAAVTYGATRGSTSVTARSYRSNPLDNRRPDQMEASGGHSGGSPKLSKVDVDAPWVPVPAPSNASPGSLRAFCRTEQRRLPMLSGGRYAR